MISFSYPRSRATSYNGKTSAEKADHHFEKFFASQKLTLRKPTTRSRAAGY